MRRLTPALLALAAVLLGCSSGSGAGEDGGRAGTQKSPAATEAARGGTAAERSPTFTDRLPIARYSYTEAESTSIESAQQILTRRCMRTFGIAYEPPAPEPGTPEPAERRYGLSSAAEAARLGYHPDRNAASPSDRTDLSEDALLVFYGRRGGERSGGERITYKGRTVPVEGCYGQAVGTLAKRYDDGAGAAVASRIASDSYQDSLADPSVKDGFGKWSRCMRGSGYRYTTPMDPLDKRAFQGREISAEEKETATADVRCKEETGLLDIWFKAESRIQRSAIEGNKKALERLRVAHQEKAEAARLIVARGR
ncbi:hypothetical protein AB0F46_28770 [Streptomyces sp. NPDC026665]|uniref:hypothetical protein n=1 Tax=Streptomyces sp. NPDC026665 TaxID=3154798 RepID=UPI0033FBDAB9